MNRQETSVSWLTSEMIFNEYPELDMDEEAVMDLTKKELLNWLNHFYTDNIKETCYG